MPLLPRMIMAAAAVTGGVATSQAPEFTQQYKQRIGGALQELQVVVEDFDRDARASGLERSQALETYGQSTDTFLRDRGQSMTRTIARFESLQQQRTMLEDWHPVAQPAAFLRDYDPALLSGTWADYEPAVPTTLAGGVWAGLGALVGWLVFALLIGGLTRLFRRKPKAVEPPPANEKAMADASPLRGVDPHADPVFGEEEPAMPKAPDIPPQTR